MTNSQDMRAVIINGLDSFIGISRNSREFKSDEKVSALLEWLYGVYYQQIHEFLSPKNSLVAELEIRGQIKDIAGKILPAIVKKMRASGISNEYMTKYAGLYDNFYALVAFRSLKHFVLYSEFEKPQNEKIWTDTLNVFDGFWYYANKAVLDGDYKFIEKQLPTGYGKTYSDAMLIAFIFGNNINDDVLKVFGASENVSTFTNGLADIMASKFYAKVFPYFAQFECDVDKIFSVKQIKDTGSKLRISGSKRPVNIRVVSKDKSVNGVRAKWLFLDDITQAEDADNVKAHERDIFKLVNSWFKRNYDLRNFFIVVGGTTYSCYDILSWLLEQNNVEDTVVSKINKYTKIGVSDYITSGGKCAFVCVPKLDWETDESTYPSKFPTADARRMRERAIDNGRMFEAMEQQRPFPSEDTPFAYGNIATYDELEPKERDGGKRSDYCKASLDLPRTGKNNISLLICSPYNGKHYPVDALYERKPLDYKYEDGSDELDRVCDKIIQHWVTEMVAETNTSSNIKQQLLDRLAKRGWGKTKILEVYSTQNKQEKIWNEQTSIQQNFVFPSRNVFAPNSMMGNAMRDITTWSGKKECSDDAPDCLAMYSKAFVKQNNIYYAKAETFRR